MTGKRVALTFLVAGAVLLSVRHTNFESGDHRHWAAGIPTGTEESRCMGMTRSQYVPFWCLVGFLTAAFYAGSALQDSLRKKGAPSVRGLRERLRRLLASGGAGAKGRQETGSALEAHLLETGECTDAPELTAVLPTEVMEQTCASLGVTKGLETASLAVFLVLQHRRTYGSTSVASLPLEGKPKMIDVELALPHMSFAEVLAATDKMLEAPTDVDADDAPEVTFAWGRDASDKVGHWSAYLASSGRLSVTGFTPQEARCYKLLFDACAKDPRQNVWDMPVMTEVESRQVSSWGAPPASMEKYTTSSGALRTFPQVFADATSPGHALAVAGPAFRLDYAELRRRVAAVARAVRSEADGSASRPSAGLSKAVIVYMGRGEAVAPTFFGVLQAGYFVVPIDVHWPVERVRAVAADASAALALTEPATQDRWAAIQGLPRSLVVDEALFAAHGDGCLRLGEGVSAASPAIALFTSGSTGKPKGIVLSHGYVMTLAAGRAESLRMDGATRTLLHQSPTWMPFIDYLFGPMLAGGCCVFVPEQSGSHAVTPNDLRALAKDHEATILGFVPPVLDIFLDEDLPPKLRCLCVGGAAVPAELCRRVAAALKRHENGTRGFLATGYHGTEQGDVTQIQVSCDEDVDRFASMKGFMTSGRPHTTQRCAVLDQGMRLVGLGGVGEITVSGPGLASGYLNLPEKTAETFLRCEALGSQISMRTSDLGRWTSDGSLEVVGRRDSMVKVRGARVELGEVEAAVSAHPDVRSCVVVVHEDRLVAYVAPAVPADLRDTCKARLASYMVPHIFEGLEVLPQLANGKINKKALPAPTPKEEGGSETVMELDSLGQMRKLTRASATEDRILDNVRAILMVIVIQSHATPVTPGSMAMRDIANIPIHADWSYLSYVLLVMSRSGGWSALAYMAGFDDTRGDSPHSLTYREALFMVLWVLSGFKWTLWFLPAFVYMRVLFVAAHRYGVMKLHMLVVSQIWLTLPIFVDWYAGWEPAPAGEAAPEACPAQCLCPFEGRLWAESIAYYSLGMWTVGPGLNSHSFIGRGLFFVPCYWLGFYSGRPLFKLLARINDAFSCKQRLATAAAAGSLYYALFTNLGFIEAGFDDRCSSFWRGDAVLWAQVAKNVAFYAEDMFTSLLYVIIVVALVPVQLKRLAKTSFAAYIAAAFAPVFCLVDLPTMALEIRSAVDPAAAPMLETLFVFAQPVVYVLAVGSVVMWLVQTVVRALVTNW